MTTSFDSQHQDMIMDYYGKRLATCSSDRAIKIFSVQKDMQTHLADLLGHEGPVWQVAWAHPKFGTKLASCSYDRKVIVWSEDRGRWAKSYVYAGHELSINSISWAPHEFGQVLVCGSSDGHVSVLTQKAPNDWSISKFEAHPGGVNAVSWAPAVIPSNVISRASGKGVPVASFASAGCDNLVKIWQLNSETGEWKKSGTLEGHKDWVRDVAWAPNAGLPYSTIASCSQDGSVIIWTQSDSPTNWSKLELNNFNAPVWRVSWSVTGNILAVSCGDNTVTLWKELVDQGWKCISTLNEEEKDNE